jgi:hypothetical protein
MTRIAIHLVDVFNPNPRRVFIVITFFQRMQPEGYDASSAHDWTLDPSCTCLRANTCGVGTVGLFTVELPGADEWK